MRVAVALGEDGTVFPGHFAHAPVFAIYEVNGNEAVLVEERKNPLGDVPDIDDPRHAHSGHGHHHHHHGHLHGPPKYMFLRGEVLPDVDVVVAGGACPTSVYTFNEQGCKVVFVEPGTPVHEALPPIVRAKEIPMIGVVEDGIVKPLA